MRKIKPIITQAVNESFNNTETSPVVAFHVGRGGRFHNPGFKKFVECVKSKADVYDDSFTLCDEDEDGNKLPESKWKMYDGGGNIIDEGADSIYSETGYIEIDGEYDTWIIRYIDDCTDDEIRLIADHINKGEFIGSDVEKYMLDNFGGLLVNY